MSKKLHFKLKLTQQDDNANAEELILILHGMNCSPDTMKGLIERIKIQHPNAQYIIPDLPLKWDAFVDLRIISRAIANLVESTLEKGVFKRVILMGHSAGGALVQSIFLSLHHRSCAPLSGKDVRLVLIAPLTRGWEISHHVPKMHKMMWILGTYWSVVLRGWEWLRALAGRRKPRPMWILQLRKGSPFIVGLRLRWRQVTRERPIIYNLLGSVDELISWRDMVDEVMEGNGSPVRYREVGYSNHAEIVDVEVDPDEKAESKEIKERRAKAILTAMVETPDEGREQDMVLRDSEPEPVDDKVTRVVFVIHGIRDLGHWTQKIAARCIKTFHQTHPDGDDAKIRVETSSYGFFSMLEFLRPSAKREKVQWLMEEYVEARRRFPNARFSYIGHSNGTYLLAQALAEYRAVKFDRLVFAGSVVSSHYAWKPPVARQQVRHVLNFTAHKDVVVSFFPRMVDICPPLRFVLGKYLGGAGVVSFATTDSVKSDKLFVKGGHGAAIEEWNWQHLADFAISSEVKWPVIPSPGDEDRYVKDAIVPCRKSWGTLATPVILVALVSLVIALGRLAWLNPWLFWGPPLVVGIFGLIVTSTLASMGDSKPFKEQKAFLKWAGRSFALTAALIAGWLLLGVFSPLLMAIWGGGCQSEGGTFSGWLWHLWQEPPFAWIKCMHTESLRTLSAVVYVLGLHRIVTKV